MTPDESHQLLACRLQHKNEMRGIGVRELVAPLPFPRCVGWPRLARCEVSLVERPNVEVSARTKIIQGRLAEHEITDPHRRWRNVRSAVNHVTDTANDATEVHTTALPV